MDTQQRAYLYAFLSRIFSHKMDEKLIADLKIDTSLLDTLSPEVTHWFLTTDAVALNDALNVDFSTLFLIHAPPIESSILEEKDDVLVGLQNPVMQFYVASGYDVNLTLTDIQTPDHLAIELAFMQKAVQKDDKEAQRRFLETHLLVWVIPYLMGIKGMAATPFYQNLCEFTCEFLAQDYEELCSAF